MRIVVPDDYGTIREAVEAAVDGDVIVVRPGVYRDVNIDLGGKDITITSKEE